LIDPEIAQHWELLLFFFAVAAFYSSVGFGGGSSYLAILALYSVDFLLLRSTALMCNIAVVAGSAILYYRNGLIHWKKVLPIVVLSVPFAFLGGMLPIRETAFFILLGAVLCVASVVMWIQPQVHKVKEGLSLPGHTLFNAGLGGSIGFLAGMVGIGGGIFLSPVLHLLRWATAKAIAATASIFILVNSIAGLVGQSLRPGFDINWKFTIPLLVAVVVGGQLGARLGIFRFEQKTVKRATAILILIVSVRILWKYLG
jgi:uncharacterized membrane protein YfcA